MRVARLGALGVSFAGLVGLAANAEEATSATTVAFGGEFFAGLGLFADDRNAGEAAYGHDNPAFQQDLLLHGSADFVLNDRLTIGVYAHVRADELRHSTPPEEPDAADFVKSAFVQVKHAEYGEFQLGHEADVRVQQGYWAPQICDCLDGFFGTNSPQITFNNGPVPSNTTTANLDGRATKLAWYSPDLAGVSIAVSLAPERQRGYRLNPMLDGGPHRYEAALDEFASVAIGWQGTLGETSVGIGGGATRAERSGGGGLVPGRNDAAPVVWDVGFSAAYAAWKFGGGYEQQRGIAVSGTYGAAAFVAAPSGGFLPPASNAILNRTIDLGVTYSIGPVTAGVAWSRGWYEGLADTAEVKRASDADTVVAGAKYLVQPGIEVTAAIQWNHYDPNGPYRPLPAAARLDATYGGGDPTINIWGKSYGAVGFISAIAIRF